MKKIIITSICIFITIIILCCGFFVSKTIHPSMYKDIIQIYSNEYNLSPSLVASLINVESAYKENARSSKNALGLMQLKLETANYMATLNHLPILTETDLLNADTNIKFGCMYLNYLSKKFTNQDTMLCAYNAGETRVKSWLRNEDYSLDGITLIEIPIIETKNYIEKINKNLEYYSKLYD